MVYVYVLRNLKDNGYYISISENLESRLIKHNKGGVQSTSGRRPFKLIYFEEFNDYLSARLRKKQIKSYKGGNKFRDLIIS